jgi:serine/threonine protein phosphatase PrpC
VVVSVNGNVLACPRCGAVAAPGSRFCEEDGTRLRFSQAPSAGQATSTGCACIPKPPTDADGFCEVCGLQPATSQIQGPSTLGPDLAVTTDVGKRKARNEDAGAIGRGLVGDAPSQIVVVADGVSTSSSSDVLAATMVKVARDALASVPVDLADQSAKNAVEQAVERAIQAAHHAGCDLHLQAEPGKDPPGATFVVSLTWGDEAVVGWLGDCRAYVVTPTEASQVTRDDSWLAEALASGMPEAEALASPQAHAILHCLGPLEGVETGETHPVIRPHVSRFKRPASGWLILCSDGLWLYAALDALAALVRSTPEDASAEIVASTLVQFALRCGAIDNVTVGAARLG